MTTDDTTTTGTSDDSTTGTSDDSTTGTSDDSTAEDRPTVLVVDDEENVTEAYALWLADRYEVLTATGGEEALELLDEHVDVALLDRRMPGMTGREVLDRIRERGYPCRVAMVTAVDPSFDVVEMPFDDYVTKPVKRESLIETVDRLLALATFDTESRELFQLAKKRAALESEMTRFELDESEGYQRLVREFRERQERLFGPDDDLDLDDPDAFVAALEDPSDGS